MANNIIATPYFKQKAKRLLKKYHSLGTSLLQLEQELLHNPKKGNSYGDNIYKIRIEGEGKGKSGGYRLITYLVEEDEYITNIYLITIFTKSEESTITKPEVVKIIKKTFS